MLVGSGSDLSSDCFQSATCMVKGQPGTWAIFTPHLEFPFSGFLSSRIPSSFCVATGCPLCLPLTPPTRKTWDFSIRVLVALCPFYYRFPLRQSHIQKKTQEIHPVAVCFLQVLTPLQNLPVSASVPEPFDTCF